MNSGESAERIFLAGVASVLPDSIIRNQINVEHKILKIGSYSFNIDSFKNIYIIGAGKATALMAREIETILGDRITEGHIIVKHGSGIPLRFLTITEAGHPIPDSNGLKATEDIIRIVSKTEVSDLIICLLSGGGSSLLTDCPEGCLPDDVRNLNSELVRSGATIGEINIVRKHLSNVKGGQLAKKLYPSTVLTLVLSDVIGDSLEVIGSGPTFPDSSTFSDAIAVLLKYKLKQLIAPSILNYLHEGTLGKHDETPKENEIYFKKVHHFLVGSNKIALQACLKEASKLGYQAEIISDSLQGDCKDVASSILQTTLKYQSNKLKEKPICLLFGGEPTLKVTGNGMGGRNQHLALLFALLIAKQNKITFLSAGTDGSDGPTLAAGAVVDHQTVNSALANNNDPLEYLRKFDSYNFFKKAGGHIVTGHTMTNVMDIMVVIIE